MGGSIFVEFFDLKEEWEHLGRGIHQAPHKAKDTRRLQPSKPTPRLTVIHSEFHSTRYNDKAIGCQSKLCHIAIEISLKKHLTPLTMGSIF